MTDSPHLLSIDQGTTSSRAMVFDAEGRVVTSAQREFRQMFPKDGWVEHDPEEIWQTTTSVAREALQAADRAGARVVTLGITNQRETTLIWDRNSGKPIYNAIVWQDRRTAEYCTQLKAAGNEPDLVKRSGLLLDPYFSASKIAWLLDNVEGAREKAKRGDLAFGTVDSFLVWRLTDGKRHVTDATNASRTALFNIHNQTWDPALLEMFDVPGALLPEILDCAADFGTTTRRALGRELPIQGIAGDQQAASIGQACFSPGILKSTYGTGCFALLNTGKNCRQSSNRLLTTVAYRLNGETTYALEGSIFAAGTTIQWLRDGLRLIAAAGESEQIAHSIDSARGVYLVPAFTGLGAPYWDPAARGAILGLTRDTGIQEIVRAALEAVCYQTVDLIDAMVADGAKRPATLRVDGGMAANGWLLQSLADLVDIEVERPAVVETTALGAAYLAGLQAGVFNELADIENRWCCGERHKPAMDKTQRDELLRGWHQAVNRILNKP